MGSDGRRTAADAPLRASIFEREQDKYRRMWAIEDYRTFSPGEEWRTVFLEMVGSERGTLVDAGCGTGQAGKRLAEDGFDVTLWEMVTDAVSVSGLPIIEGSLWHSPGRTFRWGYCTDVMEHIPTEFTMLVADTLLRHCQTVFFSVATEPDSFGVRIGEPLHLTVKPFTWWRDRFSEIGVVMECRDLVNTGLYLVSGHARN